MGSDGETEEDVSADVTSFLNEEVCSRFHVPKNPSSRRKEVVDAKERSSIGDLNNFLSNFNDQARIVESLSQKAKMAGTICLALAAAKKLNRSPASLRCKPSTNVLITMSPVL
ncbi:unnamed protein product [Brassica oleracea]